MKLKFSKMHGLGNDFMVIDGVRQTVSLSPEHIRELGDRHFGIGFDQLLLVEPAHQLENDFRYRIYNNDGSEVQQCGNGARCFVKFVIEQQLTAKRAIRVETARGVIVPEMDLTGRIVVNMGTPRFTPQEIPFLADTAALAYPIMLSGKPYQIAALSMGNPHAVLRVEDLATAEVATLGPALESHPSFPERVNAGFMQVIKRNEIALRVYERGAGETLACGTGACAAVVAGIRQGWLDHEVLVHARGGDLTIRWQGEGHAVMMSGPAVTVFTGEIETGEAS